MTTALIPAYNCERTIGELVRRAKKYVDHVIVVDDGSQDRTAAVAKKAGAKVVRLKQNVGKATALRYGTTHVKDDILVFLDGDLQHLPEEIPRLIQELKRADVVIGSRFLTPHTTMPLRRRFTNRTVSALTRILTGYRITDVQSGFRAFGKRAIEQLRWEGERYNIEIQTIFEARRNRLEISEVPITTIYGSEVSYLEPVKHTITLVKIIGKEAVKRLLRR